jgi:virulence factor Mce-like protein
VRRLIALASLIVTAIAVIAVAGGCGSGSSGTYRVDAIFDSAGFLTPGVDVRVGGADVGRVKDLKLTRDHKARIEMEVDRKFAPFRANADCTIQSQSLISEKFVDCAPGTPDAPALRAAPGATPVLPVANTHSPVDIDLVLNIFNRPVRERLALLLDGLGSGLASRGDDLNATILRAAPALQETRRVLSVLDADRTQLRSLISNSDTVLRSLGSGRARVAAFVRNAGGVAATSGARRAHLAEAVRRLPKLLAEARPSLAQLGSFAKVGTPFAERLRASAPGVQQLVSQLGPFSTRVTPTVTRLGTTARRTTPALTDIAPQIRRLRRFASAARPAATLLAALLTSARDSGVPEGLGNLGYYGATALARFDKYSHILPAYILSTACAVYARTPTPGCDAHYKASASQRAAFERALRQAQDKKQGTARRPAATPTTPAPKLKLPALPNVPGLPQIHLPGLPTLPELLPKPLKDALDFLLR